MNIIRFAGFAFLWILLRDNYLVKFVLNSLPNRLRREISDLKIMFIFYPHVTRFLRQTGSFNRQTSEIERLRALYTYCIKNRMGRSRIRNLFNVSKSNAYRNKRPTNFDIAEKMRI